MRRGMMLRRSAVSRTVLLLLLLMVDMLGRRGRLCRYASCVGSGGEVVRRCCCNAGSVSRSGGAWQRMDARGRHHRAEAGVELVEWARVSANANAGSEWPAACARMCRPSQACVWICDEGAMGGREAGTAW